MNGSSGTLDGVSIVQGHELAEAITDPLLNAWYGSSGSEIGDRCAWVNLQDITTSGGSFAVQPLWSNAASGRRGEQQGRAEALGHIRAYSRRQRSWFRKLGASRVGYRSAVKVIVSRL